MARDPFEAMGAIKVDGPGDKPESTDRDPFAAMGAVPVESLPKAGYSRRPDVSISGEAFGGLEQMGRGVGQLFDFRPAPKDAVLPIPRPPSMGSMVKGAGNIGLGALRTVGSLTAPISNLTGRLSEYIAEPLQDVEPQKPLTPMQRLYAKDMPGGSFVMEAHPASVVGNAVATVGDIAAAKGISKVASKVSPWLVKKLPTVGERLSAFEAQRAAKVDDAVQRAATARTIAEQEGEIAAAGTRFGLAQEQQRLGSAAAQAAGPIPPTREAFRKRYSALAKKADQYTTAPVNLNARAMEILQEPGVIKGASNPAERIASATANKLTLGGDPEEIGREVRRLLNQGQGYQPANNRDIVQMVVGPITDDNVSVRSLIDSRRRVRWAERAAYDAGHKNLARQFGALEDAITADIMAADKANKTRIGAAAAKIDSDYFKKKTVDWWNEGVGEGFNPANNAWDRGRFAKWWEKYSDVTDNDKFLRRQLGTKYDEARDLVRDMQQANEMNIEKAARVAIRSSEVRTKLAQSKIAKSEAEQIKAIESEYRQKVKDISGHNFKAPGSLIGALSVVGGVHAMTMGSIVGGAKMIAGGLFTISHADTLAKVLNTAQGFSVTRRLIRAVPGTAEASAASAAFVKIADQVEREAEQGVSGMEQAGAQTETRPGRPPSETPPQPKPRTRMIFDKEGNPLALPEQEEGDMPTGDRRPRTKFNMFGGTSEPASKPAPAQTPSTSVLQRAAPQPPKPRTRMIFDKTGNPLALPEQEEGDAPTADKRPRMKFNMFGRETSR